MEDGLEDAEDPGEETTDGDIKALLVRPSLLFRLIIFPDVLSFQGYD